MLSYVGHSFYSWTVLMFINLTQRPLYLPSSCACVPLVRTIYTTPSNLRILQLRGCYTSLGGRQFVLQWNVTIHTDMNIVGLSGTVKEECHLAARDDLQLLELISSRTHYRFVRVISKSSNFATFPKNLLAIWVSVILLCILLTRHELD
jgi:hypothetical protein